MIRSFAREQLTRLSVKTLDQVFVMQAKEGLGCPQFEAEALTDLLKEVYFPWLSQPEAIQAGQLAMTAVSADEPGHKPSSSSRCRRLIACLPSITPSSPGAGKVYHFLAQPASTLARVKLTKWHRRPVAIPLDTMVDLQDGDTGHTRVLDPHHALPEPGPKQAGLAPAGVWASMKISHAGHTPWMKPRKVSLHRLHILPPQV